MKKVIDSRKRSKMLSEVKPVRNISKNLQSFLETSQDQLQDHAIIESFWIKGRKKLAVDIDILVTSR